MDGMREVQDVGFRLRKSVNLGGGVRLNLSRRGVGISAGVKGLRVGVGPRGAYRTVSLPGTGLSHTTYNSSGDSRSRASAPSTPSVTTGSVPLRVMTPAEAADIKLPPDLSSNSTALGCMTFLGAMIGIPCLISGSSAAGGTIIGLGLMGAGIFGMTLSPKSQAAKAFKAGMEASQKGEYTEALAAFGRADATLPLPSIKVAMAQMLAALGRVDEAVDKCRAAIASDPLNPLWRFRLCDVLVDNKRYEDAAQVYADLPAEIRGELPVLVNRALCYVGMERYDLALALLETGPLLKRSMDPMMVRYRFILGRCYEETGKRDKAISQYTRVVAEESGFEDAAERLEALHAMKVKRRRKIETAE